MTHLDSQLAHGRRLLVILISPEDPNDQYAISGIARWDGSALWLQSDQSPEPVLLTKPGGRLLLLDFTPEVRGALRDASEHEHLLAPLVNNAGGLALTSVDRVPAGAIPIPGAIGQAIVSKWKQ